MERTNGQKIGGRVPGALLAVIILLPGCASSSQEDPETIYNKGTSYYYGYGGFEIDYKKACDYFRESAELGYALAQFNLGNCYREGKGRLEDIDKAIGWYEKAAEQDVMDAKSALGTLYIYEFEDHAKWSEAIDLLVDAANDDSARAQFILGTAYFFGRGVEAGYDKAISLYERAAESGNIMAVSLLYHIYSDGLYGKQSDKEKADHWKEVFDTINQYQSNSDWTIEYAIAGLYKNGWGVAEDDEKYETYMKERRDRTE